VRLARPPPPRPGTCPRDSPLPRSVSPPPLPMREARSEPRDINNQSTLSLLDRTLCQLLLEHYATILPPREAASRAREAFSPTKTFLSPTKTSSFSSPGRGVLNGYTFFDTRGVKSTDDDDDSAFSASSSESTKHNLEKETAWQKSNMNFVSQNDDAVIRKPIDVRAKLLERHRGSKKKKRD